MTRVVAGTARGRRLQVPPGDTRPTTDRAREALFSALGHTLDWMDTSVLDAFAGSGALGLEAASRGAPQVLLVERDRRAAAVLRANAEMVAAGSDSDVRTLVADTWRLGARASTASWLAPCGLVLLDPPYREPAVKLAALLGRLVAGGWCAADAVAVIERSARDDTFEWPAGWRVLADRRYGESRILTARLVLSESGWARTPAAKHP